MKKPFFSPLFNVYYGFSFFYLATMMNAGTQYVAFPLSRKIFTRNKLPLRVRGVTIYTSQMELGISFPPPAEHWVVVGTPGVNCRFLIITI